MNKLVLTLVLASSVTITAMTTLNLLDTFVFVHKDNVILVGEEDFDFDVSSSQDSAPLSTTPSSSSQPSSVSSSESSSSMPASEESSSSLEDSSSSEELSSSSDSSQSSEEPAEKTTVTTEKRKKTINNKDVSYYVVDIHLARLSDLRTHLAFDETGEPGANITKSLGDMVAEANAKLSGGRVLAAIAGDFPFWKGRGGYVVRNGVTYRNNLRTSKDSDLAIYKDGTFYTYYEKDEPFDELNARHGGIYQNWCFGPTLLQNGEIMVDKKQEIDGQTMSQNERTAIGFAGDGHFYFLVTKVNGSRSNPWSSSFSLYHLATTLLDLGCTEAYNLDGGASATLYDAEQGVLMPTDRTLGDIIYVVER